MVATATIDELSSLEASARYRDAARHDEEPVEYGPDNVHFDDPPQPSLYMRRYKGYYNTG